ncbi:uncharacterized protein LOC131224339 [Magnolia sinica]|uniref:uncharacterized protein LOC131224339 n=1 Tax=Magnolia sinica TaxID=86752 RepID=UPI0026598492|nr:uncharacterized protein LOC131224339 [Magnolia sinica]
MTVGQNESKFTELSRFAPFMIQDEARKAKKFERGLRGSIRNKLTPLKLRLYADVVERALMIERDNEEFWKSRNQKREAKSNARAASNTSQTQGDASKKLKTMVTNTSTPAQPMNRFTGKCYNCGIEGHSARFCKQPPQQPHYQALPQMHPRPQPQFQAHQPQYQRPPYHQVPEQYQRNSQQRPPQQQQRPQQQHYQPRQEGQASRQPAQGRVFTIVPSDANANGAVVEDKNLVIATPIGSSVVLNQICRSCPVMVGDSVLLADLIVLDMQEFDVILGMDWLASFHAKLDCFEKTVTFSIPGRPRLQFLGKQKNGPSCDFLTLLEEEPHEVGIDQIPIVCEFSNVFQDIPGLPPRREIEFGIDLMPGVSPISMTPYRMAPVELKELKEQIQKLLEQGFIRPSTSPWGAPVLFTPVCSSFTEARPASRDAGRTT